MQSIPWLLTAVEGRGFNRAEPAGAFDLGAARVAAQAADRADAPMRPFHLLGTPPYVALVLCDKENMTKCPMREPWACPARALYPRQG